jgi:1,4-alpha-glucan branching enzyme
MKSAKTNKKAHLPTQLARFVLFNPHAQEVFVAGAFNNWNPCASPLRNLGHGHWVTELPLPLGRHEYQFVVDGRWIHDRAAAELVENPLGGLNSIIEVARPAYDRLPTKGQAKGLLANGNGITRRW